MKEKKNN